MIWEWFFATLALTIVLAIPVAITCYKCIKHLKNIGTYSKRNHIVIGEDEEEEE